MGNIRASKKDLRAMYSPEANCTQQGGETTPAGVSETLGTVIEAACPEGSSVPTGREEEGEVHVLPTSCPYGTRCALSGGAKGELSKGSPL